MASSSGPPPPSADERAVLERYGELRDEAQTLAARLDEFGAEAHEHALVVGTLRPLDGARKCYRLVRAATGEWLCVCARACCERVW